MDTYIGFIAMFGFNFAPQDWAQCNGQLLPISTNTALFSLLGTTYGGDGRSTFALPDLRGRAPIHYGQGPGLSHYALGQRVGDEQVSLAAANLPPHNHEATATSTLYAEGAVASGANPAGNMLAAARIYAAPDTPENKTMAPESVTTTVQVQQTGGGQPFSRVQPSHVVNFCICMQGIFPPRS